MAKRKFVCVSCNNQMDVPFDVARPMHCPVCGSLNMHRSEEYAGHVREGGKTKGRGWRRRVRSWGSWRPSSNSPGARR